MYTDEPQPPSRDKHETTESAVQDAVWHAVGPIVIVGDRSNIAKFMPITVKDADPLCGALYTAANETAGAS